MYDAVTRDTYAQLFKQAEAKLPASVREATIKVAGEHSLLGQALRAVWKTVAKETP